MTYTPAARRLRRRLVHLPGERRHRRLAAGDGRRLTVTRAAELRRGPATAPAGTAVSIPLTCTDADGDALTLLEGRPTRRRARSAPFSGERGHLHARRRRLGADWFTYNAVRRHVADVRARHGDDHDHAARRPATPSSRHTRRHGAVSVPLSCSDADGDPLTLSITGPVEGHARRDLGRHGHLHARRRRFGTDTFTYQANDGTARLATATVSITITRAPACDRCRARPRSAAGRRCTLSCTDPDGDPLTLVDGRPPAARHAGRDLGRQGHLHAGGGYFGPDSFTYRANDGDGDSRARHRLDHRHAPRRPAIRSPRARPRGEAAEVTLSCTDPDGDALTLEQGRPGRPTARSARSRAARSPTRRPPTTPGRTRSPTARPTGPRPRRPRRSRSR